MRVLAWAAVGALGLLSVGPGWSEEKDPASPPLAALEAELRDVEIAFAKTMTARDHAAFTAFLAEETIFAGRDVLRGRDAVAAGWKRYFEGPEAPFSWQPDTSLVLASGTLGLSSGPVHDPSGKRVGTFNSTWRRDPDGRWKIVLDQGCPPCDCR